MGSRSLSIFLLHSLFNLSYFQTDLGGIKDAFLKHLLNLDDGLLNYLSGAHVPFQVATFRSVVHAVVDFCSQYLPKDNTPHLRSKFYSALENVLSRNFNKCLFGSEVSDTQRFVSLHVVCYCKTFWFHSYFYFGAELYFSHASCPTLPAPYVKGNSENAEPFLLSHYRFFLVMQQLGLCYLAQTLLRQKRFSSKKTRRLKPKSSCRRISRTFITYSS
jgi:hypothetical protein